MTACGPCATRWRGYATASPTRSHSYEAGSDSPELLALVEVEIIVERIIRAGEAINAALAGNRPQDAADELSSLRADGITSHFSSLVDQAIFEKQREVQAAHEDAVALSNYINRLLPVVDDGHGGHQRVFRVALFQEPYGFNPDPA